MTKKGCQDVALSNVWGPKRSTTQRNAHSGLNFLPNLARTVGDTILVTLELGYHYLWVDRYCIDQNDGRNKALQINQMDLIKQEAEITVIATAGDDPSFGLPGVTAFQPRASPVQVNIGDLKLGAIMYPIKGSKMIEGSKWNSRGWSYQEAILSRRRLSFTEAGVIFDCPVMRCHETLAFPMQNEGIYGNHRILDIPLQNSPERLRHHTPTQRIFRRQLTYSSDHLDGFRGVLKAYERWHCPVQHHWGVPVLPPKGKRRLGVQTESCRAGFVLGLCWSHTFSGVVSSKQLPNFPS
jgi:hypothetical protein